MSSYAELQLSEQILSTWKNAPPVEWTLDFLNENIAALEQLIAKFMKVAA